MKKVSPAEFRDAFIEAVLETGDVFSAKYTGLTRDYTCFVREVLLPQVAKKLGLLEYCSDYYTLDAIFFEEKDPEHFPPHTTYARHLSVAIEHENKASGSHVEMNKLQLFNVPLKVLITYKKEGSATERLLTMYQRIVQGADCFEDIATHRRQLVIIGDPNIPNAWRFYVYGMSGFVPLAEIS